MEKIQYVVKHVVTLQNLGNAPIYTFNRKVNLGRVII